MLFITNRHPEGSDHNEIGREFVFDMNNNSANNHVFYCERTPSGNVSEIGSQDFFERIRKSDYKQVLLYIHGFSNMPENVFVATEEMQYLCDTEKSNEVLVIPLIWPCDNDMGIVGDYWDDQQAADQSAYSFARVLQRFVTWQGEKDSQQEPCLKRINMLSHSMGNRVLREALIAWKKYHLPQGIPLLFRNTFMVAADVVNETLHKGEKGELISHASRNVTVYYANDDLALRSSKVVNLKNKIASRRLGHTGPEDMSKTPENIYRVDCDDVNNLYDTPKGHSYFRYGTKPGIAGAVFSHIFNSLISGRVHVGEDSPRSHKIVDAKHGRSFWRF